MKKTLYISLLASLVIFGACSTGEAASAAILQMFGGSSQALLFINCKVVSEDEIEFEFSQPVTVKSLNFEPELAVASIEEGATVKVTLEESPGPAIEIKTDILAEDEGGNTINVLLTFRTRNNRMPRIVINEIKPETTNPRSEFIEFKILSEGNIGGMRVVINGNTNAAKETIFEFLPAEVKTNEYITLHLRTRDPSVSRNEYGNDLSESGGTDSSPTARDIWMPSNEKLIHKTAAVYLLNQDDDVLDAVMLSENDASWWAKDYLAETANMLFQQNAWKTPDGKICGPTDSVISGRTTNTRTICRDETTNNSGTAAVWYVTVTSGATPGKRNNPNRFE